MLDDPLPHQRLVEIRRQQRQLRRWIPPPHRTASGVRSHRAAIGRSAWVKGRK
jgi:hypothetical protein